MLLLLVGESARGLAQVDLALHNRVRRLLVETSRHESAPVDQLTLARGDGEKTEVGPRLPELQERVEVVGQVTRPEQRQRLVEEFRDLLVYTYSGAISQVKDQRVEFRPFRADPADTEVEVKSRVLQSRGEPIQLNYRLEKTSDGWKIYDVNVLGAWLVESYRNSFATEIGKNGIDGLINVLSERNKRLANAATRNGKTS